MKDLLKSLCVAVFLVSTMSLGRADVIDAASSIKKAVVYPSSARVTRVAKVSLKEGSQSVKFTGVQTAFDENSLSVSGKGTAVVRILGAGIKVEYVKESPNERVRELETRLQAIDDQFEGFRGEESTLGEKKAFLESVKLFHQGQLPKDLVTKVPTTEELKSTLDFVEAEYKTYEEAFQALNIKKRELAKEQEKLRQELNEIQSGVVRSTKSLVVELECDKAGDLELELSYTLPQVAWYPLYDARVDFEKSKVVLSAFAVLSQQTGEDWNDVQLTLSTSRPAVGGQMPELASWQVRPYVQPTRNYDSESKSLGGARGMLSKMARMEEAADYAAAPAAMEAMPEPPVQEMQTAYAQSESSGASLVYNVARPMTVKADGTQTRVPLLSQTLDAVLEYAATPKLSSYAYLRSAVTNSPENQLTAGRVNIFLDGTFVGSSDITKTIATGEVFDLYLGVDEGVVLKRELVEEKSDDTLIGSIPSSTKKIAYKFKITAENFKTRPITLNLFDQIPVAQDDKIKITKVVSSLKADTEKYKDREGVYLWKLVLQPKEKKEIFLSFVVEYPRDMTLEGL